MQGVSTAFQTAALSPVRQPVRQVTLTLVDNVSVGSTIAPTANTSTNNAAVTPASKAVNGKKVSGHRWFKFEHFTNKAAGASSVFRPSRTDANACFFLSPTAEGGWWGSIESDASGNIAGGESFVLAYDAPQLILNITWWADSYLGTPVNFTVDYDPTGSAGWTNLATITGYAATSYTYTFSGQTRVGKLRLTITKISKPFNVTKILEFEGGLFLDVSSQVKALSATVERQPPNATLALGSVAAGELSLALDNPAQIYSPHNSGSPYSQYLRKDRIITVKEGFQYSDGSTEFASTGVYYTMDWDAPQPGDRVTIKAQDRMKLLRAKKYTTCPLQLSKTIDLVVKQALVDFGLVAGEYAIAPSTIVIPYAYCSPNSDFLSFLSLLAAAVGGVVYVDGQGVVHFEDSDFLKKNRVSSVLTLTDTQGIYTVDDSWQEGQVRNQVIVTVNPLKTAALAQIWAAQETYTVPALGTLTITVNLSSPVSGITTPAITASAGISIQSWTAYGQGGILVLQNTAAIDGTVTAITIQGQNLQADGSIIFTAQDSYMVHADGAIPLAVNNAYMQQRSGAIALAYSLLYLLKNPPSMLKADVQGLPHVEMGDKITVVSAKAGINADYWLQRHTLVDDGGLRSMLDMIAVVGDLPGQATLWSRDDTILAGNALVEWRTAQPYNHVVYQNPAANGDTRTNSFFLRGGIYTLFILGRSGFNRGLLDIYIDGAQIINGMDWYSAQESVLVKQCTNVVIGYDGYHTIQLVVDGKNASSADYMMQLTKLWFNQASVAWSLDTSPASTALPKRATLWYHEGTVLSGAALGQFNDSSQQYSHWATQGAGTNGDSVSFSFFARAGTYTLVLLGQTGFGSPKNDIYIDNVLVASGFDWYSASTAWNVVKTASVTVVSDGYHTLKSVVNGRNASATSWELHLTKIWLKQAAD